MGQAKLTERQRRAVRELHVAGEPVAEIARRYGVHRRTVWRVVREERGPLRPRLTSAQKARIRELAEQGLSECAIAARVGVSRWSVQRYGVAS